MRKRHHNFLRALYSAVLKKMFTTPAIPAFIACFQAPVNCIGQSKIGIENYNYMGRANKNVIVPMIHIETKNNWYAELRYNYEEVQTLSAFLGKTFTGGKSFAYSITPMAGVSVGNFGGLSFAANMEIDWKNFY